jgi:putative hydrolase of the HAD superfamily
MIRAVIFDIGGVLVRTENLEPRRKWERRFGLPDWGLAKIVFDSPAALEATLGRASEAAPWEHATRVLNLSPRELAELRADFWAGDAYDDELIGYIRSLRPRYQTGIISNAWPGVREAHQHKLNGDTFDMILYSAEEGLAKPAPQIYERALARLGVTAPEAVFVDDVLENVTVARALGMAGVHFQRGMEADAVCAVFEALGVR